MPSAAKYLSVSIAIIIGAIIGSGGIEHAFYGFITSLFLFLLLMAKVNIRNKNYLGVVFVTFKELSFKFSELEVLLANTIIASAASPFIFMILVSWWSNVRS